METAHTPGPWYVATDMRGINNVAIVGVKDAHKQPVANCGISGYANARLIAAAPEMLAALQALTIAAGKQFDLSPTVDGLANCDLLAAALNAIAKATGKE